MANENTNEGQQGQQSGQQGQQTSQQSGQQGQQSADNANAQGQQGQQTSQQQNSDNNSNQRGQNSGQEFRYKEDRSKWIPPHRFSEVNEKANRAGTLEAENKRLNDQLKALVGVSPKDPNDEKVEKIKDVMFQTFPWAKKLSDLSEEQLDKVLAAADNIEAVSEHVAQGQTKHAKTMLKNLVDEVTAISGELGDRAQKRLKASFTDMIEIEVAKAEQTGEISDVLQRYIDGDEVLVQDFAKEWFEDFGKPIRRQITTQELDRSRRVPNSTGRSQVTTVQRPAAFKNLDERIEFAANLAKERGMQFGN